MNAKQILENFGISVEIETLSDGSQTGSVKIGESLADCHTVEDARKLALAFAVALNNFALL